MTSDATMMAPSGISMTTRMWRWARSAGAVLAGMAVSAGLALIARLAPSRPWRHVWVAAAIGFVASLAGAVATLTHDVGPLWYPVALALTTLPCAWVGGALRS